MSVYLALCAFADELWPPVVLLFVSGVMLIAWMSQVRSESGAWIEYASLAVIFTCTTWRVTETMQYVAIKLGYS